VSGDSIDELTRSLRVGPGPVLSRIRQLLRERQVDPEKSLLLELFPDDSALFWGLLVTPQSRAVIFEFGYLHKEPEEGSFLQWQDVTDKAASLPQAGLIEVGISRLEEEGGIIPWRAG